jgi:alkylation response protein AidB-like acyl-CoA dehydrogenase
MNLELCATDLAFRDEVRRFIEAEYPQALRNQEVEPDELTKEDYLLWHRTLARKGWIAPAWPKEHGGTGWTALQRYIFGQELARYDTVPLLPFGINMVGPVIYTFGTPEQKQRFLPPTFSGDIWWCQGYSEPGAGSDLASLKTRAERNGDEYIVNGQKTWTTLAQHADWGFFLVRTNPAAKAQEGISFLLIDLRSPGVTVRPLITIDGTHEVNEIWLENVRVPVENRVFRENEGWTCAKFLLEHERSGIARVARSQRALEHLIDFCATDEMSSPPLLQDPYFARKVAEVQIELLALEYTELRLLTAATEHQAPGPESSLLKIKGSELQQRITELAREAAGHYGIVFPHRRDTRAQPHEAGSSAARRAARVYLNTRKVSIYGGSNEIQRNIIAKRILNL